MITQRRRDNLTKLAYYLESLPEDYAHFEMSEFFDHEGDCELVEPDVREAVVEAGTWNGPAVHAYARDINAFLNNCGTVACAIGHAPAAGIPIAKSQIERRRIGRISVVTGIKWSRYAENFVPQSDARAMDGQWDWLFGPGWALCDNHHWGAAARIRYLLDKGEVPEIDGRRDAVKLYQEYRVDVR